MSPACKHSVRKLIPSARSSFHRETLKPSSEKYLIFVNPVFPAQVEYVKRLPAWRFAEARAENNIGPDPPRFVSSPLRNGNEFQEFSCAPERHTARRARALRRRHARRSARVRDSLDGRIAATALPALPMRGRHALGHCARLSPLPLRFLQAHIQYSDEDAPREAAQQGTLADLRRDDDRAKEHPQKRGGVRGERDDFVPLAQALPRMLLRSARENSRRSHRRLFKCLCAHGGSGGCDLGEGVAAGNFVLAGLKTRGRALPASPPNRFGNSSGSRPAMTSLCAVVLSSCA